MFELYANGAQFTIKRDHVDSDQEVAHWNNKDQVWLMAVNEQSGEIVLNTVEDHLGLEAWHGETVNIVINITKLAGLPRTRKTDQVDHEGIKAKFEQQIIDAPRFFEQMHPEVAEVHAQNPYMRFVFGRALWSYVPKEDSLKIDRLLEGKSAPLKPELLGKSWSWMMYPLFPNQRPSIVPSSTDHTKWLALVDTEWDYATDEQRELMQRCLAKMREDGHETPNF